MDNIIVNCGKVATDASTANTAPCTIADLIITANNFAHAAVTILYPLLLVIAASYTAIRLLLDINKPEALSRAKKNVGYIIWGSVFILGAWGIMRFALALLGWKGSLDNAVAIIGHSTTVVSHNIVVFATNVATNMVTVLLGADTAFAASFENPLNNTDVQTMITNIISYLVVAVSIIVACAYVYVGFIFISNSDNPEKLKNAKKWFLIVSIVALLFFSLKGLTSVLITTFGKLFSNQAPVVTRQSTTPAPANQTTSQTVSPVANSAKDSSTAGGVQLNDVSGDTTGNPIGGDLPYDSNAIQTSTENTPQTTP